MKDLHIVLSDELAHRLDYLCEITRTSRVGVVRDALATYLRDKEDQILDQEMLHYATEMAPYSKEFTAWSEAEVDRMFCSEG
jgi:predicted DNA-binding protein